MRSGRTAAGLRTRAEFLKGERRMDNWQATEWVRHFVREQVREGDLCIDATMGNGHDTLFLAQLVGPSGHVTAFDIQEQALENTKKKLEQQGLVQNCTLLLQSHEHMDKYGKEGTVSCVMFNLGYLPGGDHRIATKASSTIRALKAGLKLLRKNGLLTLCVYSGGDTGFEEKEQVLDFVKGLDPGEFLVICSEYINRPHHPPVPVLIIKL